MLTQIEQLHEDLLSTEARAEDLRAERDRCIRALIAQGQSMYSIAQALGITQQSVRAIRDRGH